MGGAILNLGFDVRCKPWEDPTRRIIRNIHVGGGLVAIGLSVTHYVGRRMQAGEWGFEHSAPFLCGYAFTLLLVSGVLRFWTRKPWRKYYLVFAYLHRLSFVAALYYLTRHVMYQTSKFGPH